MTGEELRKRRIALKFTQEQLAEALGTTRNTIARWERGEISIEHPEMLNLALDKIALKQLGEKYRDWLRSHLIAGGADEKDVRRVMRLQGWL